ncbi:hypothetical protein NPX13_g132 [Xylaria arbuscula]|uniref:Uncharacterized protein n=1 Tax=Xylaria arbuscula TaxID=114810 RepID=A0A9W8NNE5_9PEZI|nr:hypothetical protein NPX13_g132 [Xylaria arbuscula]
MEQDIQRTRTIVDRFGTERGAEEAYLGIRFLDSYPPGVSFGSDCRYARGSAQHTNTAVCHSESLTVPGEWASISDANFGPMRGSTAWHLMVTLATSK